MATLFPVAFDMTGTAKVNRDLETIGKKGKRAFGGIERSVSRADRRVRAIGKTTQGFKDTLLSTTARLGPLGQGLAALGPAALAATAALGALGLAIKKVFEQVRPALDFATALQEQAETAGLTTTAWQELTYAASQFGVTQVALRDGMKELALRADEFAKTGKGPAREAFERLGFTAEGMNTRLDDTDALFEDVIDRMDQLGNEAAQIRVADELFGGTGGEQFVRFLRGGVAEIRRFRAEAQAIGIVMDEGLIERARESKRELETLDKIISVNLHSAVVDLAPILARFTEIFAEMARFAGQVADAFRDLENRTTFGIEADIEDLAADMQKVRDEILQNEIALEEAFRTNDIGSQQVFGEEIAIAREVLEELGRRKAELEEELSRRDGLLKPPGTKQFDPGEGDIRKSPFEQTLDRLILKRDQLGRTDFGKAFVDALNAAELDSAPGDDARVQQIRDLVLAITELEAATEKAKDAEKERQQQLRKGESLTRKLATAGEAYNREVAELNRLHQAGAIDAGTFTRALEDAEKTRLQASKEATDGIKRGLADYAESSRDAAAAAQQATTRAFATMEDALTSFVSTGKIQFGDFTRQIAADLARLAVKQTITAPLSEALGSAFGSVFSFAQGGVMTPAGAVDLPVHAYARGGIARSPQLALYGEGRTPEAYVPLPDGRSIPVTLDTMTFPQTANLVFNTVVNIQGGQNPDGTLDEQARRALGRQIERTLDDAVKRRLERESRPGGLINRGRVFK